MPDADPALILSDADVEAFRRRVAEWKGNDGASRVDSSIATRHLARWQTFVATDWDEYDVSEYDHALGCRYWLELLVVAVHPDTAERVAVALAPSDATFRARMRPCRDRRIVAIPGLTGAPYFWETHALHPDRVV